MKNLLAIFILFFFAGNISSQASAEFQLGGSNFLGWTINGSYELDLSREYSLSINPYIGAGSMVFPEYGLDAIVHGGIDFRYKRWALGAEASHFFVNPFLDQSKQNEFIDLLIYPNLSYKLRLKSPFYLKFSMGAFLAYEKSSFSSINNVPKYRFAGDVIPGAALTTGYTFGY